MQDGLSKGQKWYGPNKSRRCYEEVQEYTEELYKKDLHDSDNHNGMITHLKPNILECEVKWAWESITMNKTSGCDGIPVKLFQILKEDAVKVLHSICQQIWKIQQWPQDWKRWVFIPNPKKGNAKEYSNYCCSHAFRETISLLRTMQIVECRLHRRAQGGVFS